MIWVVVVAVVLTFLGFALLTDSASGPVVPPQKIPTREEELGASLLFVTAILIMSWWAVVAR